MSHVKGHMATIHGKQVYVKPHEDKRTRKPVNKTGRRHVVKIDPGMNKMRGYITQLLRTADGQKELVEKIKSGGFSKAIPEVSSLYGVEQAHYHVDKDAFDHTMSVVRSLPADATDNQRWAALLHDIGKAETQRWSDGRQMIVFDGHERAGAKLAKDALRRLQFKKEDRDEILYLIKNHHKIRTVMRSDVDDDKFKFAGHRHFDSLVKLHEADVKASGRDPKEVLEAVDAIRQKKSHPDGDKPVQ